MLPFRRQKQGKKLQDLAIHDKAARNVYFTKEQGTKQFNINHHTLNDFPFTTAACYWE